MSSLGPAELSPLRIHRARTHGHHIDIAEVSSEEGKLRERVQQAGPPK
jgi:hypothetical protein